MFGPELRPATSRVAAHAAALLALLLILMPLVGVQRGRFISDEGGVIMQVDTLRDLGSWSRPYPLADLDPDGRWVPINYAAHDDGEIVVYPSRPVYVVANLVADRVAGLWGMTALGLVGVAVGALFAGLLAREMVPAASIPAVWLTGIGSPMLFHGFVLQGHAVGAAFAAVATYAALRSSSRSTISAPGVVLLGTLLAAGSAIRRETLFLAAGLAVSLLVTAGASRRRPAAVLATATIAGALVGLVVDLQLTSTISGRRQTFDVPAQGFGRTDLVPTRLTSGIGSFLRTSYAELGIGDALVLAALATTVTAAVMWRRRGDAGFLVLAAAAPAAGVCIRLLLPSEGAPVVPGLLVAAPLLALGGVLVRRPPESGARRRMSALVVTLSIFTAGVLLTQYADAGAWEWGARFLAVGLPLGTALAAGGLVGAVDQLPVSARRAVAIALAASLLATGSLALGSQRDVRQRSADVVEELTTAAGSDLIVSTALALGRFDTTQLGDVDHRWAGVLMSDLERFSEAATDAGVERFVLVGWGPWNPTELLPDQVWETDQPRQLPRLWVPLRYWVVESTG